MGLVRRIYFSQLVRGSLFVFIAGNFASFGNFLYNLAMGRMLSPANYGELEAVLSLSVLSAVPLSVLSVFLVKIASSLWGQEKKSDIKSFLSDYRLKLFVVGLAGSVLLLFFSPFLIKYLNLSSVIPVIFLSLLFLLSGLSTVNNCGLQGTLSFGYTAVNGIAATAIKLVFSVILVFLNFQITGALFGSILGTLAGFLLSTWELKNIFKDVIGAQKVTLPALKITFFPSLFASLSFAVFLTVDVILARHYFSASLSGEYAAIATLGKIVYFAAGPVISVMFPLISSRAVSGKSYFLPLLGSLVMILGIGCIVSFIFWAFPGQLMALLFAGKYADAASYLGLYSFFMILFSVNSALTLFLVSVSYFRHMWLLFCVSMLQGIFIILFHSSISQVIWVNISVSFLYFVVVSSLVIKKEWRTVLKHINSRLLFRRIVRPGQS